MRLLTFASVLGLCGSLLVPGMRAAEYDLPSITTLYGREYQEVFILGSDEHGLMFRHRNGVAKLSFSELSQNFRDMFQPVSEVEQVGVEPGEEGDSDSAEEVKETDAESGATAKSKTYDLLVATRTTIHRYPVVVVHRPVLQWRSGWPRFQQAHLLADPVVRELALREFLYTSGLGCLPPSASVCGYPVVGCGHLPVAGPFYFRTPVRTSGTRLSVPATRLSYPATRLGIPAGRY